MILTIEKKRWVATVAYPAAPEPVIVIPLGTAQKCLVSITTKVAFGK
jgi:hypothetical protein